MTDQRDGRSGGRLKNRARIARWLCLLSALSSLIGLGALWVDESLLRETLANQVQPGLPITLTPTAQISAALAASLPAAAFVWAMLRLASMFHRIESGRVMAAVNARALAGAGGLFIAYGALSSLAHTLQVLAATLGNAPGQRALSIQIGSPEIGAVAAGAALLAFGLVMSDAARLAEENEGFV